MSHNDPISMRSADQGNARKAFRTTLIVLLMLVSSSASACSTSANDSTPPIAVAGADAAEVEVGIPIQFSAAGSGDNVGVVDCRWDFGDGTEGTGVSTAHSYEAPGTYVTTLTVLDEAGNQASASVEIDVSAYWPTEEWRVSSPEEQGMDPALLRGLVSHINEQRYAIDSVLVIRNGHIVLEEYWNIYDQHRRHELQSVTKSFSSVLIGIAIQQGLIDSVNQRMVDFFPDYDIAYMDSRKENITLQHLLTMSDGMDWHELDYPYDDSRNTLGQMWVSQDAVQHVLDRPMARDPGETWAYNSGTSILLGGILEQVTGEDVLSFAREHLFDPIGIGEVDWAMTRGNHYHTDGGLRMTPRDMARLGYLMLNEGTWDGQEIVSPDWVRESTTTRFETGYGSGYGYQWWTLDEMGAYMATGHYDQRIYVVPEEELVVIFTANIADQDVHPTDMLVYWYVLQACIAGSATSVAFGYIAWGWHIATAFSLAILAMGLARNEGARWQIKLTWILVTVLFGPLGLLVYSFSQRHPERQVPDWWRAIGASVYSVTGNALGLALVVVFYLLFLPDGDAGPAAVVVPFLMGWLVFRAPLVATRDGDGYWLALYRAVPAELVSTLLALAGMLPVLILLPDQWRIYAPAGGQAFWGLFSLGAVIGAAILCPYNYWMVRRNSALWPGRATTEIKPAQVAMFARKS